MDEKLIAALRSRYEESHRPVEKPFFNERVMKSVRAERKIDKDAYFDLALFERFSLLFTPAVLTACLALFFYSVRLDKKFSESIEEAPAHVLLLAEINWE